MLTSTNSYATDSPSFGVPKRRADVGDVMPIRLPVEEFPDGIGWHIEGNHWKDGDYWTDVMSRGRGLFTLFLFTDGGPADPDPLTYVSHISSGPARAGQVGPA